MGLAYGAAVELSIEIRNACCPSLKIPAWRLRLFVLWTKNGWLLRWRREHVPAR